EEMTERAHHHDVRVARIDPDPADVARRGQAERFPGLATIGGLENAAPRGEVIAQRDLPGAHIDRVRCGRCDRERANGGRQTVAYRPPGPAGILSLPDAAPGAREVER